MDDAQYFYAYTYTRGKFRGTMKIALTLFFAVPCAAYSAPVSCDDLFQSSESLIRSSLKESHLSFNVKNIDRELVKLRKALEQPVRSPSEKSALINQTKRVRTALAVWERLPVYDGQDAENFRQKLETLRQMVIAAENESHAAEF